MHTRIVYVSEALSEFDFCVFDVAYGKFYVELSIISINVDGYQT